MSHTRCTPSNDSKLHELARQRDAVSAALGALDEERLAAAVAQDLSDAAVRLGNDLVEVVFVRVDQLVDGGGDVAGVVAFEKAAVPVAKRGGVVRDALEGDATRAGLEECGVDGTLAGRGGFG